MAHKMVSSTSECETEKKTSVLPVHSPSNPNTGTANFPAIGRTHLLIWSLPLQGMNSIRLFRTFCWSCSRNMTKRQTKHGSMRFFPAFPTRRNRQMKLSMFHLPLHQMTTKGKRMRMSQLCSITLPFIWRRQSFTTGTARHKTQSCTNSPVTRSGWASSTTSQTSNSISLTLTRSKLRTTRTTLTTNISTTRRTPSSSSSSSYPRALTYAPCQRMPPSATSRGSICSSTGVSRWAISLT